MAQIDERTPATPQRLAREMLEAFETAQRGDLEGEGETFDRLKKGSPEWMTDVVYAAHDDGEMLPDDWRYKVIRAAVEAIAETEDGDEVEGFADGQVDIYTGDRLKWLGSNLHRPGYCDEAVDEFGGGETGGIVALIGLGQYWEADRVLAQVSEALVDEADDRCSECGSVIDGGGYDGLCGDCADRAEGEGRWS